MYQGTLEPGNAVGCWGGGVIPWQNCLVMHTVCPVFKPTSSQRARPLPTVAINPPFPLFSITCLFSGTLGSVGKPLICQSPGFEPENPINKVHEWLTRWNPKLDYGCGLQHYYQHHFLGFFFLIHLLPVPPEKQLINNLWSSMATKLQPPCRCSSITFHIELESVRYL